jgi:hypothetical protein
MVDVATLRVTLSCVIVVAVALVLILVVVVSGPSDREALGTRRRAESNSILRARPPGKWGLVLRSPASALARRFF